MERIAIVGSIGSGKSTLADALGKKLGRDVLHLDELWWEAGRYERTPATAKTRTMGREQWQRLNRDLVDAESWIIDGSLDLLALRLAHADLVVFIDLPRRVCVPRVATRWCASHRRGSSDVRGAIAWLWVLLRWVWKYPQKRIWILSQIAEHATGADIVRLESRRDVRLFLDQVVRQPQAPGAAGGLA